MASLGLVNSIPVPSTTKKYHCYCCNIAGFWIFCSLVSSAPDSVERCKRGSRAGIRVIWLMDKILHDLKDSKLWELWYIPYNG